MSDTTAALMSKNHALAWLVEHSPIHARLRKAGAEVAVAYTLNIEGHTLARDDAPAPPPARAYRSTRHEAGRRRYMEGLKRPAPRVLGWDLETMIGGPRAVTQIASSSSTPTMTQGHTGTFHAALISSRFRCLGSVSRFVRLVGVEDALYGVAQRSIFRDLMRTSDHC
jgi:hypothetical protein